MKNILITLLSLAISLNSYAFSKDTKLLLIGGGARPQQAMEMFAQEAGADRLILIFPWASGSVEAAQNIMHELKLAGATKIEIIPHEVIDTSDLEYKITHSGGIFFTGGDQNKLMNFINRYQLKELLQEQSANGVIFAGTSAGTAIMSKKMLTGNGSETTEGLGLLPAPVVVDQHFIVRNRWQRLANIVLENNLIGLGIDEDNALFIQDGRGQVIGPTMVQTLIPYNHEIQTHSYHNGESISVIDLP